MGKSASPNVERLVFIKKLPGAHEGIILAQTKETDYFLLMNISRLFKRTIVFLPKKCCPKPFGSKLRSTMADELP